VQGTGTANVGKEKSELVSRAFEIKLEPVETDTVGQYLNVSAKLQALPIGAWNIILTQMETRRSPVRRRRYGLASLLLSTSTVDLAADAAAADTCTSAVWAAALLVFQKTGMLPEWIAAGPTAWARLGSHDWTPRTGRCSPPWAPVLPSTPWVGMDASTFRQLAVRPGCRWWCPTPSPSDAFVVGNRDALEVYEYAYPLMEAVEPSILGRQVAVASELATYRPATDGLAGDTPTGNGAVIVRPAGTP
jgi:hypothetical protein